MRKERAHAVKALVEAEEGERRNYKIDYSSLTLSTPIGAGGFGIVYKGEYLFILFNVNFFYSFFLIHLVESFVDLVSAIEVQM
jgi:hypothetical protein